MNISVESCWRVGDQTADGLDGNSPTGRFVEFGYAPQSEDGSPIEIPSTALHGN